MHPGGSGFICGEQRLFDPAKSGSARIGQNEDFFGPLHGEFSRGARQQKTRPLRQAVRSAFAE
jgi:hypothetical protein